METHGPSATSPGRSEFPTRRCRRARRGLRSFAEGPKSRLIPPRGRSKVSRRDTTGGKHERFAGNVRRKKKTGARVDPERPDSSPFQKEENMRKLIVSEFVSLDGVIQAPGGA